MPKYTFDIWETSKYQVIFDADSKEDARKILNATRNLDELPNVEQKWIKGNEDWDVIMMQEVKEDETNNKENDTHE
jgi:hypothetical protein